MTSCHGEFLTPSHNPDDFNSVTVFKPDALVFPAQQGLTVEFHHQRLAA